jgi:hypothetical protein
MLNDVSEKVMPQYSVSKRKSRQQASKLSIKIYQITRHNILKIAFVRVTAKRTSCHILKYLKIPISGNGNKIHA